MTFTDSQWASLSAMHEERQLMPRIRPGIYFRHGGLAHKCPSCGANHVYIPDDYSPLRCMRCGDAWHIET